MIMKQDFHYDLPEHLIAQHPLAQRDGSRLLVLPRSAEMATSHRLFADMPQILRPGDCLVMNNTKVMPARLLGVRRDSGAAVELLLLQKKSATTWEVIVRPGRRVRVGHSLDFIPGELSADVLAVLTNGNRIVRFNFNGIWETILDRAGVMPLPPYIHEQLTDPSRYQTVYARHDGSAAAPTAGLHFTMNLIELLQEMGVIIVELTLHIGLGTFRPVKHDNIQDHIMHAEYYHLSEEAADRINAGRRSGGRIIAVGTTSCRVLETLAEEDGELKAGSGWTQIYIFPGYRFKAIDGLITNFHLPESTLIMLVSALAGRERVLAAYQEAIELEYRFFSFGDAMLII
ncbi:MAG: tRNA preQ1(34) S-adenosylmethionine ribosyltransferase-isomerase QueA [Saccharofermentanales bacterium]|jgi:S-adenosylmethionine:tRNA ribosyltransferase-isomerase|nr:tRNA preQ1(34) S-adenosylmethionine ribosyltransferase-isomerase QueA [Clostridiaceae bacterium]